MHTARTHAHTYTHTMHTARTHARTYTHTMHTAWASNNTLKLNADKSRELLLHRRGGFPSPPPIDSIIRVTKMSMLGVTIAASLVTLQKSSPPVIILSILSMLFAPNSRCKTNLNSPSLSADTGAGVLVVDWHLAPTERQEDEDWYNAGGHELRQLGTTRPTSKRCLVVCDFTRH